MTTKLDREKMAGSVYDDAGEKFTYADAPSYTRQRGEQISALTDAVLNRKPFSYDAESDPAYQQYRDSYTRQGKKAMEDTLGKVSARTGGLASSYAGQAAQQTYDDYMAALADKIPELRQLAYQMYQDEGNRQMQNISLLRALDEDERADYLTALNQYNADRSFGYGMWNDEQERKYRADRDAVDDAWRQTQWDYGVQRDELSDAEKKSALLAAAGDFSGFRALGYTEAEIAGMKKAYDETKALSAQKGRSSGGGSRGGKDYTGLLDQMDALGDDNRAYLYLLGQGLSNDKTDAVWQMYQQRKQADAPGSVDPGAAYRRVGDEYAGLLDYIRRKKQAGATVGEIRNALDDALQKGMIDEWTYQRIYHQYGK